MKVLVTAEPILAACLQYLISTGSIDRWVDSRILYMIQPSMNVNTSAICNSRESYTGWYKALGIFGVQTALCFHRVVGVPVLCRDLSSLVLVLVLLGRLLCTGSFPLLRLITPGLMTVYSPTACLRHAYDIWFRLNFQSDSALIYGPWITTKGSWFFVIR